MGWSTRFQNNDPSYLEPRISNNETQLAQIAQQVKSNGTDDTTSLTNALNSNSPTIFLPDGVYKITNTMLINSGVAKKVVGTKNTVLSIQLPAAKTLLDMSVNIAFENITFDFNNGYVQNGLLFRENLGEISIKNCTFKNVVDTNNTYGSIIIYIANNGNKVNVDGLFFSSIKKTGNGTVGDAGGTLNCLFVTDLTTTSVINGGTIKNVRFEEIHNIDNTGAISYEDTTGIFVASGLTDVTQRISNIVIQNIYGYNFGKRLIKTQVGSLTIDKVYGKCDTGDSLSVVGVMDCQNVLISNIRAYGKMLTAISTTCKNTIINNVDVNIQIPTLAGVNAYGVSFGIGSDDSVLNNFSIQAERSIVFQNTTQALRNMTITNGNLIIPSFGTVGIQFLNGSYGFDGLIINNVTLDNNSTQTGNTLNFLDTINLTGGSKTGNNLQVNGITITSFVTTANVEWMFYLYNITNAFLKNILHKSSGTVQQWRTVYIENGTSIDIKDLITPYINTAVQIKNSTNISLNNVKITSNSTYISTVTNSTKVKIKDSDLTKVYFADTTSQQNTFFNQDFASGTTANRPTAPTLGLQYFDTTLNKPIWCKTVSPVAWIDATGAAV